MPPIQIASSWSAKTARSPTPAVEDLVASSLTNWNERSRSQLARHVSRFGTSTRILNFLPVTLTPGYYIPFTEASRMRTHESRKGLKTLDIDPSTQCRKRLCGPLRFLCGLCVKLF